MITENREFLLATSGDQDIYMLPQMGNRHGLITGATGTGKTVTLQTMAEGFSTLGVPVFMADVKGDLSGVSVPGQPSGKIAARIQDLNLTGRGYANKGFPTVFWDVFGAAGHPLRTTVSDMGPLLLSRILGLNEVQAGLLHMVFRIADDSGLLLLDLKDLRSMLKYVSDEKQQFQTQFGNISAASVGAVQRGLLRLEEEGGNLFFGEPALSLEDMLQTDGRGFGHINILAADRLIGSPQLYSTLLLWLLSELYEKLPECGDQERPRLVFFFDEAHMLFAEAQSALLQKINQVVKLIRSKGVGIYFVTQNPADVPDSVLSQLGNRVQHALRAYTPRDQKAVKAAASAFRANPAFATEQAITELGVGEALVSMLDAKGAPSMVQRALIVPPEGRVGPLSAEERTAAVSSSVLAGVYDKAVDRESAYEVLAARARQMGQGAAAQGSAQASRQPGMSPQQTSYSGQQTSYSGQLQAMQEKLRLQQEKWRLQQEQRQQAAREREAERERKREQTALRRERDKVVGAIARQTVKGISSPVGRAIGGSLVRGILGSLFGSR